MALTGEQLAERVRDITEAFNRGEYDAASAMAHPDVVLVRLGAMPEVQGVDGLRAWMEPDAFETQHTDLSELQVEGRRVLVRQHTTARGAGSGIEMAIGSWAVWSFDEDGRVTRIELLFEHEEDAARRALLEG
jgi:ketosteroid isomerase-like protein